MFNREVWRKGTVALGTTFTAGLLFGQKNMMIAFVLILGSNILSVRNFRIKLWMKIWELILFDTSIIILAYIASLTNIGSIMINLSSLFGIIYLTMSPFEPLAYKTFMMLYVFSQYSDMTGDEIPQRLIMVICCVLIVVGTNYLEQGKDNSVVLREIKDAFKLIGEQIQGLDKLSKRQNNGVTLNEKMQEIAYSIYQTRYHQFFTTYWGKLQFEFYLSIGYFMHYLKTLEDTPKMIGDKKQQINVLKEVVNKINDYFAGKIEGTALIEYLDVSGRILCKQKEEVEFKEGIKFIKRTFENLQHFDLSKRNKLYKPWRRHVLGRRKTQARLYLTADNISFNFALRMAIVLTISLQLADWLGYYKMIWAIIPIMSIAQPYYEVTHKRARDRIKSNIIAAIVLTLVLHLSIFHIIGYVVLIIAFYLIFVYKDYYHYSFYMTLISMTLASVDQSIEILLIYRIIYVLVGSLTVMIVYKIIPYHEHQGIQYLISRCEDMIERMKKEEDIELQREGILQCILLCRRLERENKQYQQPEIEKRIKSCELFCLEQGNKIIRNYLKY